jgi:hypothetical protein
MVRLRKDTALTNRGPRHKDRGTRVVACTASRQAGPSRLRPGRAGGGGGGGGDGDYKRQGTELRRPRRGSVRAPCSIRHGALGAPP